jgi:hypothetical protein
MAGSSRITPNSKHEAGANSMKNGHLPQASLAPFGTFEIEISEIFAEQR